MNMRRSQVLLIGLLLLALVLAACGGAASTEQEAPASEPQQTQPEDAAQGEAAEDVSSGATTAPAPSPAPTAPAAEEPAEELDGGDRAADDALEYAEAEEEAMAEEAEALTGAADQEMMQEDMAVESMPAAPPAPEAAQPPAENVVEPDTIAPVPGDEDISPEPEPDVAVEINPFTNTVDDSLSTFAMDVDTASYSAARNYINNGSLPPAEAVRVEEFVNYFRYAYPNADNGAFGINVDAAPSPFTANTQIVRVGIQGLRLDDSQRDDAVLTFVIDISGSMDEPNRLPLVKESLRLLVDQLRDTDQVAIVVYSDDTRVVLEHTPVSERGRIIDAIESLQIEGATNVEAGLRLGYEIAAANFENDAINRVILLSDGVANVGATGPDAILQSVRDYAAQGVLLTTVGFGMGDFNDYMMEQLANDGNGNYAYVDSRSEAERVFIEELTGTLQVIAKDAKIQVDFNPDVVSQYRLLGYENRDVADEDFRNDEVDAGEVGAGHSVTALYEVRLTGQGEGNALTAQVRYEDPESGEVRELQQPLSSSAFRTSFEEAPANMQLAVAVAAFAEHLRGSGYAQDRPLDEVLAIAERVEPQFANDTDVQEFVELVRRIQAMQ